MDTKTLIKKKKNGNHIYHPFKKRSEEPPRTHFRTLTRVLGLSRNFCYGRGTPGPEGPERLRDFLALGPAQNRSLYAMFLGGRR